MTAAPPPRPPRRGGLTSLAATAAVALHLLFFGAVGLEAPRPPALPSGPDLPVVEMQLQPRLALRDGAGAPASGLRPAAADGVPSPLEGLAASRARAAPPSPRIATPVRDFPGFFAGGLPGCGREDLILLTLEEKAACSLRLAEASLKVRRGAPDAPSIDPLATLAGPWRAALDGEAARRGRRAAPPLTACKGQRANLGGGCLPVHDPN